jgi:hypothetical protein
MATVDSKIPGDLKVTRSDSGSASDINAGIVEDVPITVESIDRRAERHMVLKIE